MLRTYEDDKWRYRRESNDKPVILKSPGRRVFFQILLTHQNPRAVDLKSAARKGFVGSNLTPGTTRGCGFGGSRHRPRLSRQLFARPRGQVGPLRPVAPRSAGRSKRVGGAPERGRPTRRQRRSIGAGGYAVPTASFLTSPLPGPTHRAAPHRCHRLPLRPTCLVTVERSKREAPLVRALVNRLRERRQTNEAHVHASAPVWLGEPHGVMGFDFRALEEAPSRG